ncbi:MAG: 2Fe-2S iron-sulfur cluster-binding protein [Bacteroidia bacterium]|nr:2Fe-2S iron-sulfur cluster-binding protein [Bacteroidia bacterium]MCX7763532.1 2Fe-2S iron-sulfur cluster-binding protein [Bacteroidia bacterium]MDW8057357.1 2Fe-2S iron-sulfur cluster-binding protein [Bacteroidia bacterium]
MPTLYIDGRPYEYEKPGKLLQFCIDNGIEIPYFCYHPGLSIPANCRMCLVETGLPIKDRQSGEYLREADGSLKIAWGPKPTPSCTTDLVPDLHVRTHRTSEVVRRTQEAVLEFILINHPLDCPICDQAGECILQIWTYKYGPEGSRFEEEKVHKPKRIQLGPRVILDAERCINCTRCVRFTQEVSKTNQLTIVQRGNQNYPATAHGQPFDDPYSLNTVDICPVGALTSADHRFKARPWEMNYTPTICTGCARGCNAYVWVRDNLVMRFTPRKNMEINQFWLCDEGRLDYKKYNERRASGIRQKGDVPVSWDEGLSAIAQLLQQHRGKVLFVGSAYASVETLYVLKAVAAKISPQAPLYYIPHEAVGWGDHLLRQDDRTPNRKGAQALGYQEVTIEGLLELLRSGAFSLLYWVEDDQALKELLPHLPESLPVVAHLYQLIEGFERLEWVLPAATHLESFGTYVNGQGIAQTVQPARQWVQMTPQDWFYLPKSRLDAAGQAVDRWRNPAHIPDCLPSYRILMMLGELLQLGLSLPKEHLPLWERLKAELSFMSQAVYPKLLRKEIFRHNQLAFAVKV